MTWYPGVLLTEDSELILTYALSLNATRIDSLAGRSSSLALARAGQEDDTVQPLIEGAEQASPKSLTTAKIFSADPVSNWLSTEGQAISSSRASAINGSGTYKLLVSDETNDTPTAATIEEIVANGTVIEVKTKEGFDYRLTQQCTGAAYAPGDSISITVKRLGRNLSGFALYRADPTTGAVTTLPGESFTPEQPGYAQAALDYASVFGLLFEADQMPAYGEELIIEDIPVGQGSQYGILFFDATKTHFYSSFSAFNPGNAVQVQSFAPENDNQQVFGFEDIQLGAANCDFDYNDLILTLEFEPQTKFEQLVVFGDSLSDFGSRSAALYQQVLAPTAQPPWSGSTFSNAQANWQTFLRSDLDIFYDSQTGAGISNSFIGGPPSAIPASPNNPSYAMGGALSGTETLYEVLAGLNPPQFPPFLLGPPYALSGRGVESQIEQALTVDGRELNQDLVMLWSGGNNLLAAVNTGEDLPTALGTVLEDTRASLIALLRSGQARSVVVSSLAPLQGEVNGVSYSMPFLDSLPPEWKALIEAGAATQFRNAISAMIEEVQQMFPYAALVDFNNEYGFNWSRFGIELGDFADYGIANTTQSSQANLASDANTYLFFNDVHPTQSGHKMLARAIELTLGAEQEQLDAAYLSNQIVADGSVANGSRFNDAITAFSGGSELNGFAGNDQLTGLSGDDWLNGGDGNDVLTGGGGRNTYRGGMGADVFAITTESLQGGLQTISDFNAAQGDRLLLSGAFADAVGDLFFLPTQQDWQQAISFQTTGDGGLLSIRFGDPSIVDGVIALNGVSSFDTAWLS